MAEAIKVRVRIEPPVYDQRCNIERKVHDKLFKYLNELLDKISNCCPRGLKAERQQRLAKKNLEKAHKVAMKLLPRIRALDGLTDGRKQSLLTVAGAITWEITSTLQYVETSKGNKPVPETASRKEKLEAQKRDNLKTATFHAQLKCIEKYAHHLVSEIPKPDWGRDMNPQLLFSELLEFDMNKVHIQDPISLTSSSSGSSLSSASSSASSTRSSDGSASESSSKSKLGQWMDSVKGKVKKRAETKGPYTSLLEDSPEAEPAKKRVEKNYGPYTSLLEDSPEAEPEDIRGRSRTLTQDTASSTDSEADRQAPEGEGTSARIAELWGFQHGAEEEEPEDSELNTGFNIGSDPTTPMNAEGGFNFDSAATTPIYVAPEARNRLCGTADSPDSIPPDPDVRAPLPEDPEYVNWPPYPNPANPELDVTTPFPPRGPHYKPKPGHYK